MLLCICLLTAVVSWAVLLRCRTTNFIHGFPCSCVSIALVRGQEPVVGVVFNPASRELFQAVAGQGAYLNGRRIRVSGVTQLTKALVVRRVDCWGHTEVH